MNVLRSNFSERRNESCLLILYQGYLGKKGKNIIGEINVASPYPPFRKHKGFKYMQPAQLYSYPLKGHQLHKLGCVAERNKN